MRFFGLFSKNKGYPCICALIMQNILHHSCIKAKKFADLRKKEFDMIDFNLIKEASRFDFLKNMKNNNLA